MPIRIQLYRERYSVPPNRNDHLFIDTRYGHPYKMERAYVGNVEFFLPYNELPPYKSKYGHYFGKKEAVTEVLKTSKGSDERQALIHFMVKEGLVPCKEKYLYALVSQVEKNGMQILWDGGICRSIGFGRPRGKMKDNWGDYHYHKQIKVIAPDQRRCPWLLRVGTVDFQRPRNTQSNVYTKREALRHIAKTKKGSEERGAMIRFMVQEGYVLCKEKCLTDLVRKVEVDHLPVGSDEWRKRGRPTNRAAAHNRIYKQCDDDRIFCRDMKSISELIHTDMGQPAIKDRLLYRYEKGWKDNVLLWLIPIRFRDSLDNLSKLKAQHIDICTYIGYSNDMHVRDRSKKSLDRTYRLYFPPQHFPPPKNLNDGGNSIEFAKVRAHIREGSRVFCNGGKNEKIFTCNTNYKARHIGPSCPFGFTVRWDRHGFYIHLLSHLSMYENAGCPFHCCSL